MAASRHVWGVLLCATFVFASVQAFCVRSVQEKQNPVQPTETPLELKHRKRQIYVKEINNNYYVKDSHPSDVLTTLYKLSKEDRNKIEGGAGSDSNGKLNLKYASYSNNNPYVGQRNQYHGNNNPNEEYRKPERKQQYCEYPTHSKYSTTCHSQNTGTVSATTSTSTHSTAITGTTNATGASTDAGSTSPSTEQSTVSGPTTGSTSSTIANTGSSSTGPSSATDATTGSSTANTDPTVDTTGTSTNANTDPTVDTTDISTNATTTATVVTEGTSVVPNARFIIPERQSVVDAPPKRRIQHRYPEQKGAPSQNVRPRMKTMQLSYGNKNSHLSEKPKQRPVTYRQSEERETSHVAGPNPHRVVHKYKQRQGPQVRTSSSNSYFHIPVQVVRYQNK